MKYIKISELVKSERSIELAISRVIKLLKNKIPNCEIKYHDKDKSDENSIFKGKYLYHSFVMNTNGHNDELFIYLDKLIKEYAKQGIRIAYTKYASNEIKVVFKNTESIRVKPPEFVYHSTHSGNKDSILEHGILPREHKYGNYKELAIYAHGAAVFVSDIDHIDTFSNYDGDGDGVTFEIDTKLIPNKWWIDSNMSSKGYYYTFEKIPPSAFKIF